MGYNSYFMGGESYTTEEVVNASNSEELGSIVVGKDTSSIQEFYNHLGDVHDLGEGEGHVIVPITARRMHGCLHCEWKDMGICPFGFRSGKGRSLRDNMHSGGICEERKIYLG